MEVEIAVTKYVRVSLEEALQSGKMSWDYNVVTGIWAERYYLAERDDIFLEVSQEMLLSDGSIHNHTLFYLECSAITDGITGIGKSEVLSYIRSNIDKVIPYEEISDYE